MTKFENSDIIHTNTSCVSEEGNDTMQKSKRLTLIYNYIKEHQDVQISDIAEFIEASQSTIRRDIKDLADKGLVIELYGSVIISDKSDIDIQIKQRSKMQAEEKKVIAKKAAQLLRNNSVIYLDAGTTTKQMIQFIQCENSRFVTNGIDVAGELAKKGLPVYILGGEVKSVTEAVVGEFAVEYLKKVHFDQSFVGSNGVTEQGYSTPDQKEGLIKELVIKQSKEAYVVADYSKYGVTTSYKFARREDAKWIHEKSENK